MLRNSGNCFSNYGWKTIRNCHWPKRTRNQTIGSLWRLYWGEIKGNAHLRAMQALRIIANNSRRAFSTQGAEALESKVTVVAAAGNPPEAGHGIGATHRSYLLGKALKCQCPTKNWTARPPPTRPLLRAMLAWPSPLTVLRARKSRYPVRQGAQTQMRDAFKLHLGAYLECAQGLVDAVKGGYGRVDCVDHTCSEATTDFFLCTSFWYYEWELFRYQYYGQF